MTSALVFITNGPAQASGSRIGRPPTTTTSSACVRLDTNGTLVEAVAMYDRAGYRRIERYNDNPYASAWFEKDL